jgi:hypothetical protein
MLDKMYETEEFQKLAQKPENIQTVCLRVRDLGFTENPTTDQIYSRAQEFGLELCPAEAGPYQRLKDTDQPLDDWYRITMKPITGRNGRPRVFYLVHYGDGLWLDDRWTDPGRHWDLGSVLLFRLSPSTRAELSVGQAS